MIAQHPRGGLNGYVSQTLRIQQKARHLPASDPVLGSDLGILCNVNFYPGLRIYSQQQTRKNEYPKKWVFKHIVSRRVSARRYHALLNERTIPAAHVSEMGQHRPDWPENRQEVPGSIFIRE